MPDLKNLSSFFVNVFHTVFRCSTQKDTEKTRQKNTTKKQRSGNPAYLPEIASLFFARVIFSRRFVYYFIDGFVCANRSDIRPIYFLK